MLKRHDLLTVDPETWAAATARLPLPPGSERLVAGWAQRGWPVIVRRRLPDDPADTVPVGLPLPPRLGKERLALRLPPGTPVRRRVPVALAEALAAAPAAWQAVGQALVRVGVTLAVPPRVFGALLWQHLTGLSYVSVRSDLDLLWAVADRETATALVAELARVDGPVRLDGEIELVDGGAVHWRELADALPDPRAEVLVKGLDGVALRPVARLFAGTGSRA